MGLGWNCATSEQDAVGFMVGADVGVAVGANVGVLVGADVGLGVASHVKAGNSCNSPSA